MTEPRIRLLDETLANQIAAGEVVERPAAVVKELVENALDAGARNVEVELLEGGRRLVRVRDDGSGMGRQDAELSLQRHATSKLRTKEDLFAIGTYGFRGEALPSIAAVSRFTLLTAEPGALGGTRIEIEGGRLVGVSEAGAPPGTTVEVRELFWNVPARKKFLKRGQTEQANCVDALLRMALPRCEVGFTLREGERTLLRLAAGDEQTQLRARAEDALGRDVRGRLLPFAGSVRGVRAHGLAASPDVQLGNGRGIWLFVNGRAVRDRQLMHAVLRAYGEVIPHGRYPAALVFLEVPPAEVDVNVHPAKAEVRLADGRAAYEAIGAGLTAALAQGAWLHLRGTADVAPARTYALQAPDEHAQRIADALATYAARPPPVQHHEAARGPVVTQPQLIAAAPYFAGLRYLGQLHRTYLVCEGPSGLVLVDQHAAHERIQYQRLRARSPGDGAPQPLLVPQIVELSATQAARIEEAAPTLASLGFEVDGFGGANVAVKTLPLPLAQLNGVALGSLLADLADELALEGRGGSLERLRDALLARAACHASVRAHDGLSDGEARALLSAIDATDYGARCAHGRPVVAEWPVGEIEKRFGRDYETHAHAAAPETL